MIFDFNRVKPARLLLIGYSLYMLMGWILLSLPFSKLKEVSALDSLFTSVSAISTTGLSTIDISSTLSYFGVFTVLLLIQIGGIGYMTFGSFIVLSRSNKLTKLQEKVCSNNFSLPEDFSIRSFVKSVIYFTMIIEFIGAVCLFLIIGANEGYNLHTLFSSFFHSISAFCTAGFSLYSDSFIGYRDHFFFNLVVITLSYCGAIGFIVWVDYWRFFTKKSERTTFTSKIILTTTLWFALIGTAVVFICEPSIQSLEPHLRLNASFFQVMTATTTVGFNTVPIGGLSSASVIILFFFMIFGASPSGTGGGLKSTTFSALVGLMRSTLKNRDSVRFFKRDLPLEKLQAATASFIYFFFVVGVAMFFLTLSDSLPFKELLFEVLSAVGTVGVSLGITADLSPLGKIIIMVLMTMGRVGVLTFGIAMSEQDESLKEISKNDLVV